LLKLFLLFIVKEYHCIWCTEKTRT